MRYYFATKKIHLSSFFWFDLMMCRSYNTWVESCSSNMIGVQDLNMQLTSPGQCQDSLSMYEKSLTLMIKAGLWGRRTAPPAALWLHSDCPHMLTHTGARPAGWSCHAAAVLELVSLSEPRPPLLMNNNRSLYWICFPDTFSAALHVVNSCSDFRPSRRGGLLRVTRWWGSADRTPSEVIDSLCGAVVYDGVIG